MNLGDPRHNRRAIGWIERLSAKPTASIPQACGHWADTMGAYRFFGNEEIEWRLLTNLALGRRAFLNVWGAHYAMPDGTAVRDYTHVVDLALGHLKAQQQQAQCLTVHLGAGVGYSVLDMGALLSKPVASRCPTKWRRAGDVAAC